MKRYKRNAISERLYKHCPFSGLQDFIEVTEWANGDGFDVVTSSSTYLGEINFKLTHGQFNLLKKLVKALDKYE